MLQVGQEKNYSRFPDKTITGMHGKIHALKQFPFQKLLTKTRNLWMFLNPVAGEVLFILLAEFLRAFFYDVNGVRLF